jgi:alkylated DNA repair dioxygenase AlkB
MQIKFPAQRPIVVGGVNVREPRDVEFYGTSSSAPLEYARIRRKPIPFPPILEETILLLEEARLNALSIYGQATYPLPLNVALVNFYRNGLDSMGYHDDDYMALGSHALIMFATLGASRKFHFIHRESQKKVSVSLTSGSVVVMLGIQTQRQWVHGLPKTKSCVDERWSLSFRHHLSHTLTDSLEIEQKMKRCSTDVLLHKYNI